MIRDGRVWLGEGAEGAKRGRKEPRGDLEGISEYLYIERECGVRESD